MVYLSFINRVCYCWVLIHLNVVIVIIIVICRLLIGVSSKKLESWLDKQDEDMNELREELKKERKQQENTLRVRVTSSYKFCFTNKTVDLTLLCCIRIHMSTSLDIRVCVIHLLNTPDGTNAVYNNTIQEIL